MPPSESSRAFARLDRRLQQWIASKGWAELRDIQCEAIDLIFDGSEDLIISATTASGKTEAAFLPICSQLLQEEEKTGIRVLYVGALKALINDQFERLDALCDDLEIPVHRWHGDVSRSKKQRLLTMPTGILLMTPESLEALFVLQGERVHSFFSGLSFIVVDELHAYFGSERGRQVQSLLHRIEIARGQRVRRIGLSATLGDPALSAAFLRPGQGEKIRVITAKSHDTEIKVQLRGYREASSSIVEHLYKTLRGSDNLIFPNSRQAVELYAVELCDLCEANHQPNTFLPHHGNLSKTLRETAEDQLKSRETSVSVIATTTLELGIDVGLVKSIAQIDVPPSVASLRQRLGRSGRRGQPAILRLYIQESEVEEATTPPDRIRKKLIQTVAMTNLMLKGWVEPPSPMALHPSTLVQQTLSVIAQHNGVSAAKLYKVLCGTGVFPGVDASMFQRFLKTLASHHLIDQIEDGTLILGDIGEKIVNNFHFYAMFETPTAYRLMVAGEEIGTLETPPREKTLLIFAGQRWLVESVDHEKKAVYLVVAPEGQVPRFSGGGFPVHQTVREEMMTVYQSEEIPAYLDSTACSLLQEGRESFHRLRLDKTAILQWEDDLALFVWAGNNVSRTIALLLKREGIAVPKWAILNGGLVIPFEKISREELVSSIKQIVEDDIADALVLASACRQAHNEKYDRYVSFEMLDSYYANTRLDTAAAWRYLQHILEQSRSIQ